MPGFAGGAHDPWRDAGNGAFHGGKTVHFGIWSLQAAAMRRAPFRSVSGGWIPAADSVLSMRG